MEQNKTSKYLKYAIGEIILVVIGILIALQINNWNETRKERLHEIKLVKQLLQDAKNDSVFYQSRLKLFTAQAESYKHLIDYCDTRIESSDSLVLEDEYVPFTQAADQSAVVSNSTDYNKITNDSINKLLRDYKLSYSYISKAINLHSNTVGQEMRYFIKTYDLEIPIESKRMKITDFLPIREDPSISGTLKFCMGVTLNAKQQSERFITDISELILACNLFLKN